MMYTSFSKNVLWLQISLLWSKILQIQTSCVDTIAWNNGYPQGSNATKFTCNNYALTWCSNGSFRSAMTWTGGASYRYPEFNCCVCGKDWPLWYVPMNGSTTVQVTLQTMSNGINNSLECQPEGYGDIGPCSMECKTITNINMTITLTTIVNDTFQDANCTLILQPSNTTNNTSYVIRIPALNHLIYFSNYSNIFGTQLSCDSNILSTTNTSLMCRFAYRQQSYNITSCPLSTSTSRYIPPGCVDTVNWLNGRSNSPAGGGYTCFEYEIIWQLCVNGSFVPGGEWGSGSTFNYPEYSCCACGKGFRTSSSDMQIQTQASVVDISVSDLAIVRITNCMTPTFGASHAFSLTCYGPSNISNMTSPSNFTLYGCPLTCFSSIKTYNDDIASTLPVYVSLLTNSWNITYYSLSSNLFPNFVVYCPISKSIENDETYTTFASAPPTSTLSSILTHIDTTDNFQSSTTVTDSQLSTIISPLQSTTTTQSLSSLITSENQESTTSITTMLSTTSQPSVTSHLLDDTTNIYSTVMMSTYYQTKLSSMTQLNWYTTVSMTTNITTQLFGWTAPICFNGQLGLNCTISSNPCIMARPCLNNGTCLNTHNNQSSSYNCSCTREYTGTYCEINIQPCQSITCLHRGVCIEKNLTSFECICEPGYEGDHCETVTDYCQNVTCENNAPCRSLLLNFTCQCLTNDYTGRYCERISSALIVRRIVRKSFACVAILAMTSVISIIVLMDVLKYFFHIDPVKHERLRLRRRNRVFKKKKPHIQHRPKVAVRFIYVTTADDSSTTQIENNISIISHN